MSISLTHAETNTDRPGQGSTPSSGLKLRSAALRFGVMEAFFIFFLQGRIVYSVGSTLLTKPKLKEFTVAFIDRGMNRWRWKLVYNNIFLLFGLKQYEHIQSRDKI